MLLTRLYLRNYRVFEDELDLPLPPGLVGIYGPNGAGKSTLLEAISWTLWGRARTTKDEVRSAGVGGDCIAEVEFEHEGHLYLVRRRLTGINSTPRAEVACDGLAMAEGPRDTGRYVHSVLGMDDDAFRASVFAEQKQLAAFSSQPPAERRKLVLSLLGVTPLDGARDAARRDARSTRERHDHLRSVLPDVEALRVAAADAEAAAGAVAVVSGEAAAAAVVAFRAADEAATAAAALVAVGRDYDALVAAGKAAVAAHERARAAAEGRRQELADLDRAGAELAGADAAAAGLDADEALAGPLQALAAATAALATVVVGPPPPDRGPAAAAQAAAVEAAEAARAELGRLEGSQRALAAELERARQAAGRSAELSGEAACPLCGQALGSAFEQVRAHRRAEVDEVSARLAAAVVDLDAARGTANEAHAALQAATAELQRTDAALAESERAAARRTDAAAAVARARAEVEALDPLVAAVSDVGVGAGAGAGAGELAAAHAALVARIAERRRAATTAARLRGRLEARPAVQAALTEAEAAAATAGAEVQALRDKVRSLGFDRAALESATAAAAGAVAHADAARNAAQQAEVAAATSAAAAAAAAVRVGDAEAQHASLGQLATDSVHLARVAELLSEFRNTVVASVGPRLSVQAAELFAELTDHEYDELQVDPETYGLRISDAGRDYGLERFSGSEIDLANLALRVAISEQIRFQSGGSVGLLVLDEVFGPLDEERKERMLAALERLRGRFRQVLVVTHDSGIKEQLPSAIEVVKRPGRRATARLLAG